MAGRYHPESLPVPARTATVDGYEARLDGGLEPGKARELKLKVSKGGKPVTDLQPYLAAYGHLVALRSGDLGYLHVHPNGEPGDGRTRPGPEISFTTTAPSAACVPALPGLQARRQGPHGRLHGARGRQGRRGSQG